MGVGYDEFWYFTPKDLQPFVKAFELKRKMDDADMWVQGRYIQLAVASALSDKVDYPKKPFKDMIDETPEDRMRDMMQRFEARAQVINSDLKHKNKED